MAFLGKWLRPVASERAEAWRGAVASRWASLPLWAHATHIRHGGSHGTAPQLDSPRCWSRVTLCQITSLRQNCRMGLYRSPLCSLALKRRKRSLIAHYRGNPNVNAIILLYVALCQIIATLDKTGSEFVFMYITSFLDQ